MRMTVLLFGPQARLAGAPSIAVDIAADATAADVLEAIAIACPALAMSLGASRLAVNHEFAAPETVIQKNDELALIGMVSGG